VELARRLLTPRGLVRIEIERGIGGFPPGATAPYHSVAHLVFRTTEELTSAMEAAAADLIADVKNYTEVETVLLISEGVQ